MVILFLVFCVICFGLSIKITNWLFRILCNVLGADAIFYSVRFKLAAYFFNTLILVYGIMGLFFR